MSAFIISTTENDYSTELNYELKRDERKLKQGGLKLWTLQSEMIS
jgi:hypothetical protein